MGEGGGGGYVGRHNSWLRWQVNFMHAWDRGGELGGCSGLEDEQCSGGGGDIVDRKGGNEDRDA